ncbi:Serine protease HTRA2, mitochondrial-like [Oopsacas minuta]|uniref:Serine protease HTRA2, mitochondrial-like n=1 Tax=Oopsacas minuta TaxID=111878 RepID=A0AAV7K5F2_9METZ|nr:Serine protease HTRA2, mitochondrial-like [Oopsacas minuta]
MFRRISRLLFTESPRSFRLQKNITFPSIALSLASFYYWYYHYHTRHITTTSPIISTASCLDKPNSLRNKMNFLADVCDKVLPSVVYIESSGGGKLFHMGSGGSGFIIQTNGLVLTNAHVTAGAKSVTVRLHDNKTLKGLVVAIDQFKDLALIQLNVVSPLPALKLVSTEDLRAGEMVLALGSPLRLANTITSGIVSQANRRSDELGLRGEMSYIQTDATIISGNSGGPLVNLDGEVIGINTLTAGPGVSFAIPSDYAIKMIQKLTSNNTVLKPNYYLGVQMLSLTPQLVHSLLERTTDSYPDDVREGVLIATVNTHSPANTAGLRKGDIVTQVNGKPIKTASEILKNIPEGKSMKLRIIRRNTSSPILITVTPELVEWID